MFHDGHESCERIFEFGDALATEIMVGLREENVVSVHITFAEEDFGRNVKALITKYGAATSDETSVVQNRMGASFDNRTVIWIRANAWLIASQRVKNVDQSSVLLTDHTLVLGREKREEEAARITAKKL